MGDADRGEIPPSHVIAWAEAQKSIEVLDREIELSRKHPEHPTPIPTASKDRVEDERTVDQIDGNTSILAKISERTPAKGQDIGVVRGEAERPASQIDTFAAVG